MKGRLAKALLGGTTVLVASLIGASLAFAVTKGDSGKSNIGQSVGADACYYARAYALVPGGSYQVDFKAYTYKYDRSSGCSLSFPTKAFGSGENSVRATLYRGSDFTICSSTSLSSTPSGGYSGYGIGRQYNKSGACASTSSFLVQADGYWGYDPNNWYYIVGPGFSF